MRPTGPQRERVIVTGVVLAERELDADGPLEEAKRLVRACGAELLGEVPVQRRPNPDPSTLFGKGKVDEIRSEVKRLGPDAVVVDNDLTPAHVRNLEKVWGVRVIDRSELILDIFARRAQTRQAQLQVELAQVEYLLPRLRRMWTHLERMEGAIGARGPGETQLETDRRLLRKRVQSLRRQLSEIEDRKRREVLSRQDEFTIGLVGYTNAGKSTLLNRLTGSNALAEDMLFATLDTRTRKWKLKDGRTVLVSDTVGFLQRLPHHLIASFQATLDEALNVDLLLHVVDASHPDAGLQMEAVDSVLRELFRVRRADVIVFNKIDAVEDPLRLHLLRQRTEAVHVSARTGEGMERLDDLVMSKLDARSVLVDVIVPMNRGDVLALIRVHGKIIEEEVLGDTAIRVRTRLLGRSAGGIRRHAGDDVVFHMVEAAVEPYASVDKESLGTVEGLDV